MQPLISFVIPVYNNLPFELEECIKLIQQISSLTYEVLIIDNHSDIEKSKVYKKLSGNNDKITYFYTEERGVGKARNLGIKKAKGEYIFFADADDKVIPNFFNHLTISLNDKVDLYIFNILVKNSIKTSTLNIVTSNSQPYMNERELAYNIVTGFNLNNVFGRLFRREFLIDNKIIFSNIKNGEDVLFMSDVIIANPLTKYINKDSYIYFEKVNNSHKRLINDPLSIYESSKMTFELKKSLAQKLNIDTEDVLLRINQEYIKGISNDYFDLQGVNSKESNLTKKKIINDMKIIKINSNYSLMIKLRLLILKNENKLLINMFNNLRKVYVEIFKS